MDIQPALIREKAAGVCHYLAFLYALIGLFVLLFGGFRFAIGDLLVSATQLQNPIVLAVLLTLIGRWLSPLTTLQATPLSRTVRATLELVRRIKGKQNRPSQLWMALLFLNILLFLPPYLSHFRTSTFLPLPPGDGPIGWYDTLLFFIRRENQDIFRVCGDFFLIISIWGITARTSYGALVGRSCVFIYLGLLSYQLYEAISLILFGQTSLIYDDLLLLRDAGYLIVDIMSWKLLHSVLQIGSWLIIALSALFYAFSVVKYHFAHYRIRQTAMLVGAGGWIIVATFTFWFDKTDKRPTVQWIAPKALLNVKESVEFYRVLQTSRKETPHEYDFNSVKLKNPPDIYLFVVEAYGKILAEHPLLKEEFTQDMLQWQNRFEKAGWSMTTNFSEAPVSGGKSWLSVATLMCGLRVSNQTVYALLLKNFSDFPHLVRFLQTQSYHSIVLQPAVQRRRSSFDFESYEDFYAYRRWIYYDDLGYTGQRFGWGIIPDQFSLNSAHEQFVIHAPRPLFFLFTTVTSHAPWLDLPPYVDEWEDLNNLHEDAWSDSKRVYSRRLKRRLGLKEIVNLEDYRQHINYQFQVIEDYVSKKVTGNSVVVIVGDHQPSIFTDKSHGFQTPIHILSRDTTFLLSFSEYGFVSGLVKDPTSVNSIRHEGFYSMIVRELTKRYNSSLENSLPIYYPDGISLSTLMNSM